MVIAKNSFYLYNGRSYPLQKIKYTAHRDKKIKKDQTTGNWFELLKCWITSRFYAHAHCVQKTTETKNGFCIEAGFIEQKNREINQWKIDLNKIADIKM